MAGTGAVYFRGVGKEEKGMIKRVIFDMDGLIFDSERSFMENLRYTMAEYGYMLRMEVYLSMLGSNMAACRAVMKKNYGEDYPYEEISKKARERFNSDLNKNLVVKEGIRELLEYLKENNIKASVASSTLTEHVKRYMEAAGIDQYFDTVIGGDTVTRSKPEPDIFLKALCADKPQDALVLEDSKNGILAAHNGNIPVICIPDMVKHDEDILSLCAAVAESALDVIKYIGFVKGINEIECLR